MEGPGAVAPVADGSAVLMGADSAASSAARRETTRSPEGGPCSSSEAVVPATSALAELTSRPDTSHPTSPTQIRDSGSRDLSREEIEQTPPADGGLEQKTGKIKQIVEEAISTESRQAVMKILGEVDQLSMVEKLYLYLKLPTGKAAPDDPLRQPLNPLGSRFEIQQTITWIKTHLEEDPEVSLPKQDVYDEYLEYCSHNKMKPLSNADFGKVMKQVFPCVRPRRLGTRGNSRYCYSGMRKRMKLQTPLLPDLGEHKFSKSQTEDEMVTAASCLIREWAEKLLSVKFDSLKDLACHLVEKMCVDSRSVAAFTLLSVAGGKCNGKGSISPLELPPVPPGGNNKHLETQMQLQRKLKEREMIREQKRKLQDQQQQAAAFAKQSAFEKLKPSKRAKLGSLKMRRVASTLASLPGISSSSVNSTIPIDSSAALWEAERTQGQIANQSSMLGRRGKSASVDSIATAKDTIHMREVMTGSVPMSSHQSSERRENPGNAFAPVQPTMQVNIPQPSASRVPDKLPVPRLVNNCTKSNAIKAAANVAMSQQRLSLAMRKKFYKPIQPKPENLDLKPRESIESQGKEKRELAVDEESVNANPTSAVKIEGEQALQTAEASVKLESDSMSDYFHGGHNSQEQEEELMRYFQHQTSSSSNEEIEEALTPRRSITADPTKSDQLSQLRILLERNLSNATVPVGANTARVPVPCCSAPVPTGQSLLDDAVTNDDVFLPNSVVSLPPGASASASLSLLSQRNQQKKQAQTQPSLPQKSGLLPSLLSNNHNTSTLSARRRVSFETSVTEHYHSGNTFQNTVPPSPNTRCKFFNFTPISAGPNSPLSQRPSAPSSKPSSANASPFVSPRNTPVPRNRHISSFPPVQLAGQLGGKGRIPASKVLRSNSVSSGLSINVLQPMRPRPLSTTVSLLQVSCNSSKTQSSTLHQGIDFSQKNRESSGMLNSLLGEIQLSHIPQSVTAPLSLSAPQSPMISSNIISSTRNNVADETSEYINSDLLLNDVMNHSKVMQHSSNGVNSNFFLDSSSNLSLSQQQNQPQIALPTPDPLSHEVSQFFPDDFMERTPTSAPQQQQLQYRSQSVPLHRMLSTGDFISPHYSMPQSVDTSFFYSNYSLSAASSVAPTPVPSECMDFTNITESTSAAPAPSLILDGADPGTELNSENLDRIFNIIDNAQEQQKQEQEKQQQEQQCQQEHHHHVSTISIPHKKILEHQEIDQHHEFHQHHNLLQENFHLQEPHQNQKHQETSQRQDEEQKQQQPQQQQQQQQPHHHHQHHHQHHHHHQHKVQLQLEQTPLQENQHEVGLTLDLVAADNVNNFLDHPVHLKPIAQSSRSYPNTPVPCKSVNIRDPVVSSFAGSSDPFENSFSVNGSRSLPPTPLLSILDDESTPFQSIVDRDPMLTLNALNSRLSDDTSNYLQRRNVNSLLDESLTLDSLDLQDCEGFSQLTEVEASVNDT